MKPESNKPFRQLLLSADHNLDLGDWTLDSTSLGSDSATRFRITKTKLHGGRQAGVDLIQIETGFLTVQVIPTRGMGIRSVASPQLRLGWDSPIRQTVHPQFVRLESRGGLGWLEGFNEWLVRCGLEFAGAPGRDQFVTNTGDQGEMDLTLHGKIANLPASTVELAIDWNDPFPLRLIGRVDEVMFYGPKLELRAELCLSLASTAFRLEDTVTNRGDAEQEFELIYHVNFGPPLLEAGARFLGAVKKVTPANESAAAGLSGYAEYLGPTPGFVEQVYWMEPVAGRDGRTIALLRNANGDLGVSMTYQPSQLPCFTLWKNTNTRAEGYVTGLEPGTSYPNNRRVERAAGRVPKLKGGESRRFAIDFALHAARQEVDQAEKKIVQLQSGES